MELTKYLIAELESAKKRGFVTYEELNSVLPSEQVGSEQIEDILSMLSEMGEAISPMRSRNQNGASDRRVFW